MKIDRHAVYEKYGGRCAYCGRKIEYKDMQVDHMVAVCNGGTSDMCNLMPSCRRCNHYKRSSSIDGFRAKLQGVKRNLLDTYLGMVAIDYEMIVWVGWDGKFYFEGVME